jgi:phosphatidylserine decarboxylase
LGNHDVGWFGKTGMSDLLEVANQPYKSSMKFEEMYICDPSKEHYGFKSWDGKMTPSYFNDLTYTDGLHT